MNVSAATRRGLAGATISPISCGSTRAPGTEGVCGCGRVTPPCRNPRATIIYHRRPLWESSCQVMVRELKVRTPSARAGVRASQDDNIAARGTPCDRI